MENTIVTVNNKEYTLKELAKVYRVKLDNVIARYEEGIRGEHLVTNRIKIKVKYKGKMRSLNNIAKLEGESLATIRSRYDSGRLDVLKDGKNYHTYEVYDERLTMKDVVAKYNIKVETFYARYKKGLRGDNLVGSLKRDVKYEVKGEMLTVKEISSKHNITLAALYKKLKMGIRGDELIHKKNKPLIVEYKGESVTLTELGRRTGFKYDTLVRRYNLGDRGDRLIRPLEPKKEVIVTVKGEKLTLREISNKYNISINTIRKRYYDGIRDDNIIKHANDMGNSKYIVEVDGKEVNLNELSNKHEIPIQTLYYRYKKGLRGKDILGSPKRNTTRKYLLRLSEKHGINMSTLYDRYHRLGLRGAELIKPVRVYVSKTVKIEGKEYTPNEVSEKFNIKLGTVVSKMRKGILDEKILNIREYRKKGE